MPVESSQDVFGDGPVQGNPEGGCAECGEGCCDPYGAANYEPFWKPFIQHVGADVEYLHWWVKGAEAPALVTTGPTTQTQAQAGVLGQPGTAVLFGGSGLNGNDRSGARVTLDYWFDKCENFALEGSWFGLGDDPSTYQASSTGTPILARPFLDVTTGNQDSRVIAYPGTFVGGVNASADLQLSGAEALVRHVLIRQGESRLDFLWGYRYLSLQDNLTITDTSTSTALNATASTIDQFLVSNEFNGFELGFKGQFRRERWSMDLLMKLGLGDMHSVVGIGGRTTTTTPTSAIPTASLGGLLAQPTNMGQYEQDQFAVVPELGMRVHYDLTPRMEASVGYTMLYVSKVVRAAEQVDPSINDTQFGGGTLTGLARPAFNLMTNDFWAQGIDVGLQYRF